MIAVPILLVVALLAGGWLGQRRLIYFPGGQVPPVERVPGWSEAVVTTSDGLELGAWYIPPPGTAPVVIVFHGNAGTWADRAPLGAALADRGFGVVLAGYRGYGGNPGSPSEDGLARDARAAWQFVTDQWPGHPVVLFGESLGAGVAVELATEHPPAALVLRSPFTSLPDVARVHYPFLPTGALLQDRYPSLDRIASVAAPLLVVAGSGDSIVPASQSRALYERADQPKQLVIVEGADHNDFELAIGASLIDPVAAFIEGHLSGSDPA